MYSSTLSKSELRKHYLAERQSFSEVDIEEYSNTIFDSFLKYFDLSIVKKVHCFLPIKKFKEINTHYLIDYFWQNDITVYVPKIMGDEIISVQFDRSTKLEENSWGILEPDSNIDTSENDFDLIITPLVYCDNIGNRVGYGKGFYDQFFKTLNKNALKIGVNYFAPKETVEDVWKNDITLDYLVTPTEMLSFADGISKLTK